MKRLFALFIASIAMKVSLSQIQVEDSASLTRERWRDSVLRMDKSQVPTGFLWEYSQFGFESSKYDGVGNDDDTIKDEGQIFALHNILYFSKVNNNASIFPTDTLFKQAYFANLYTGAVPLMFIFQSYNRIRETALNEGLFTIASDSVGILDVPGRSNSPYDSYEIFAFAPFKVDISQFNSINFTLPDSLFYMAGVNSVDIDFGDGVGFRTLSRNATVNVYYQTEGIKYLTARINTAGGIRTAISMINYSRPATYYAPNYTWNIEVDPIYTSDAQYLGGSSFERNDFIFPCGGSYIQQLLCGIKPNADVVVENGCDGVFDKPIIIVQGFDPNGELTINKLRERFLNGFIETMRDYGYDMVYVTFTRNGDYIENNAKVLEAVINKVNQTKTGTNNSSIIGFSMGGLITRWCLKDMEDRGLQHHVANYFSLDAPHQGANIPLGLQYLFREIEIDLPYLYFVKSFRQTSDANQSPAARQMLVTKAIYDGNTPVTNTLDPLRAAFAARLAAKG